MKNQTLILLLVAGGCGVVAMMGVKQYLDKQNQKEVRPTVTVLTALTPIKNGEALTALNTQFVTVDAEQCPAGVVTDLEQIAERACKVPRAAGDWILVEQLGEKGQIGAVQSIPPGYRVATIPVDATTNHSGMLQPGNRIDLLLAYEGREDGERVSRVIPLLEYIEVFAVDSTQFGVDQGGENAQARNISLLVTTEQMMKLTLAKKKGQISTVLRSSEDRDEIDLAGMDESFLTNRGEGSKISDVSSLDTMQEGGFVLPGMDMMTNLQAEMGDNGGSGPVETRAPVIPDNIWIMAIHEGGQVRVEHVNEDSDIPKDTRGSSNPGLPGVMGVPSRAGVPAGVVEEPNDVDLGSGLSGLEEIAESLSESFGF